MSKIKEELLQGAIDRLVRDGALERCIIDGEPGVQLTELGKKRADDVRRELTEEVDEEMGR